MKRSELREIIRSEIKILLNEDVFILWADRVSGNLAKAIKKAKYKGKGGTWNDEYKTNAKEGHGTVFFVNAANVGEAKAKVAQATEKHKVDDNVYKLTEVINESDLSDFVDSPGKTEIWYEKRTNFDSWDDRIKWGRDKEYIRRYGPLPNSKNLKNTHALLGKIKETNPSKIYKMMQGENWGQGSVTNKFLQSKGVGHTTMSIGDIIKIGNKVLFVDERGFKDISKVSIPISPRVANEQINEVSLESVKKKLLTQYITSEKSADKIIKKYKKDITKYDTSR